MLTHLIIIIDWLVKFFQEFENSFENETINLLEYVPYEGFLAFFIIWTVLLVFWLFFNFYSGTFLVKSNDDSFSLKGVTMFVASILLVKVFHLHEPNLAELMIKLICGSANEGTGSDTGEVSSNSDSSTENNSTIQLASPKKDDHNTNDLQPSVSVSLEKNGLVIDEKVLLQNKTVEDHLQPFSSKKDTLVSPLDSILTGDKLKLISDEISSLNDGDAKISITRTLHLFKEALMAESLRNEYISEDSIHFDVTRNSEGSLINLSCQIINKQKEYVVDITNQYGIIYKTDYKAVASSATFKIDLDSERNKQSVAFYRELEKSDLKASNKNENLSSTLKQDDNFQTNFFKEIKLKNPHIEKEAIASATKQSFSPKEEAEYQAYVKSLEDEGPLSPRTEAAVLEDILNDSNISATDKETLRLSLKKEKK